MGARLRLALLTGMSGVLLAVLGLTARRAVENLMEVPAPTWGMSELSDAVIAGTCTIGALGALWHLASAVLALAALPGRSSLRQGDASGLAARILDGWGAPAVRRIAASALLVSLSSAPALAAEGTSGEDDLGWRPTSSAPASPSLSPTSSPQAGQSSSGPAAEPDGTHSPTESTAPLQAPSGGSATSTSPNTSENHSSTASDAPAPSQRTYTVLPGESLWSVTTRLLPADSSPSEIAQAWPALYHANKDVIGPNPSLIRPGEELSVPTSLTAPSTTTGGQTPPR